MYQFALYAFGFLLLQELLVDEVLSIQFGDPSQAGFQRRGGVVDIMTVEAVPFLQTQTVACAESDRSQSERFTYFEERIPYLFALLGREVQLKAAGTRITRIAQYDALHTCEVPLTETIVRNRTQVSIGQQLQQFRSFRTLNSQLTIALTCILQREVSPKIFRLLTFDFRLNIVHPIPVFVNIAGIDYHQVLCGGVFVDDQVVHNTSFTVRHAGVLRLSGLQFAHVVGGDILQEVECFLTFHPELAHMAHVEHAYAFAYDHMFLVDTGRVLDRHVKSGKFCHLGTECDMHVGKRCGFQHILYFKRF